MVRDPRLPSEVTPDACWYAGLIYYNSEDPAVFVQKRVGFGYTINLGNRLTWLIIGALLAGIFALKAMLR